MKVEINSYAILKRGFPEVKNELEKYVLDKVCEQLYAKDQRLADK